MGQSREKLTKITEAAIPNFVERIHDPNRHRQILLVSCAHTTSGQEPMLDVRELARRTDKNLTEVAVVSSIAVGTLLNEHPKMAQMSVYGGSVRFIPPGVRVPTVDSSIRLTPVIVPQPGFLELVTNKARQVERQLRRAAQGLGPGEDTEADSERALADRLAAKEAELRKMRDALRRAQSDKADRDFRQVWSDPEKQFRYEVGESWYDQVPECDRDDYPLPQEWVVGPEFIESMSKVSVVGKDSMLGAVVDVLTGRAVSVNSRKVHRQRTGEAGNAPALVRHDGAEAWRCAVRGIMPASPRLLWWKHSDGVIELARIALHDDMRMV